MEWAEWASSLNLQKPSLKGFDKKPAQAIRKTPRFWSGGFFVAGLTIDLRTQGISFNFGEIGLNESSLFASTLIELLTHLRKKCYETYRKPQVKLEQESTLV